MEVFITQHSSERANQRLNLRRKSIVRIAKKALDLGITHQEAKGKLKDFFDRMFLQEKKANNARVYGEHFFVFNGTKLITVFRLDPDLIKIAIKIKKQRDENQ